MNKVLVSDDNHVLIHRYGCSVARRQIQSELKGEFSRFHNNKTNINKNFHL